MYQKPVTSLAVIRLPQKDVTKGRDGLYVYMSAPLRIYVSALTYICLRESHQ